MQPTERARAIIQTLLQMEKQFGKGAVLQLGSRNAQQVSVIPTGSISLDAALGVGGFPRGRVIEVFGPESSGKTTIALQVIAQAQAAGGAAAFIDAEHALDPGYARRLGVDVDNLLVSQPDYGEQALEITNSLVASNVIDVVVVDSVAALVPKAELEGEMGDSFMGLHARLMSQALRKLTAAVSRANACLIFINQVREKIGVMFGNPETTTGGRALKFYSSVRVEVRRTSAIKDGDEVVGNRTKIKVVKNKVAAPFREVEVDILYGQGISREGDLLDVGVEQGLIEKSGSWFSFESERIGQGRENARAFLKEHTEIRDRLDAALRQKLGLANAETAPAKAPAGEPKAAAAAQRSSACFRRATRAKRGYTRCGSPSSIAAICSRAASVTACRSRNVRPSVEIGSPMRSRTVPEWNVIDPIGKTSRVPINATGTRGTCALIAM
jgi:recombination protein RecA